MSQTLAVPGPGQYSSKPYMGTEGLKTSMHGRVGPGILGNNSKTPGPGSYEIHLRNRNTAPAYGVGSSPRKNDAANKSFVPGPN
jgi:hypothetical protein